MWKKKYFSKIFIYTCQLWKIFVLRKRAVYNFVKTLYQWLKTLLSFLHSLYFQSTFVKSLCFLHSLYFQRTFCQKSVFFNSLYFQSIFCQKSVLTVVGFARNWRWPPRLRRETTTSWRPLVEIVSLCSCH